MTSGSIHLQAEHNQPGPQVEPLVDRLGRRHTYLRLSVIDRCNLRCVYCMPPEGIPKKERAEILRLEEIVQMAGLFVRLGVNKLRLTGGEPLIRRNIIQLITSLAGIPGLETLAMTTNGVLLADQAGALKAAGINRLNISLDTLRPERFERINLRGYFAQAWAGLESALEAGFAPLKLNVVVMGGVNDDELLDFVDLARTRPIHVRFIEYMPFKSNAWSPARFMPWSAMRRVIEGRYALTPLVGNGDSGISGDAMDSGAVAKDFAIEGFCGAIGFISPLSDHFCAGCNRLRLTADGQVKSCLFRPPEASLRDALRGGAPDEEMMAIIRRVVAGKDEAHPPLEELATLENQSMIEIGG